MMTIISILFFVTCFIILFSVVIGLMARKNVRPRKQDSTFIPPYMIGDSDNKHGQNQNDNNDSIGSDFGGDGGGGGD